MAITITYAATGESIDLPSKLRTVQDVKQEINNVKGIPMDYMVS